LTEKPFDGGADQDAELVIGSNRFIPGFEEQLVGLKEGDEKGITVSFPADYQAAHLAGKEATFDIKVKAVAAPGALEINDEVAKSLGLESADKLREIVQARRSKPVRPDHPSEAEAADPRSARWGTQVRFAVQAG
jgi:trigger factor